MAKAIRYLILTVVAGLGLFILLAGALMYPRYCYHRFVWHQVPTAWLDISDVRDEREMTRRQFVRTDWPCRAGVDSFGVGDIVFVKGIGVAIITDVLASGQYLAAEPDGMEHAVGARDIIAKD